MITASIDLETTGLEAGLHEIIEISVVVYVIHFYESELLLKIEDSFTSKIRPMKPEFADPKALEVNGLDLNELKNEPTPQEVRNAFYSWHEEVLHSDVIQSLGHGFAFDDRFLRIFFGPMYNNIFKRAFIDTKVIAEYLRVKGEIDLESLSLKSLCDYFNIKHGNHRAEGDAKCTIKVYEKLLNT